jgi:hypothetical protein
VGEDARRAVAVCGESRNDIKNVSTLAVLKTGLAALFCGGHFYCQYYGSAGRMERFLK